jgi:hypothetical protein
MALLDDSRAADPDSVPLLEAYLDRVHGAAWRAQAGEAAQAGGEPGSGGPERRASGMSRAEAFEILGLAPGASPEAIKEAHRSLMQKLHPDHGGSTYLAAKINQAKDLLLAN